MKLDLLSVARVLLNRVPAHSICLANDHNILYALPFFFILNQFCAETNAMQFYVKKTNAMQFYIHKKSRIL